MASLDEGLNISANHGNGIINLQGSAPGLEWVPFMRACVRSYVVRLRFDNACIMWSFGASSGPTGFLKYDLQQLITWFVLRRRAQLIVKTQCELHNLFTGYSNAHDSHWVISLTVFLSGSI